MGEVVIEGELLAVLEKAAEKMKLTAERVTMPAWFRPAYKELKQLTADNELLKSDIRSIAVGILHTKARCQAAEQLEQLEFKRKFLANPNLFLPELKTITSVQDGVSDCTQRRQVGRS
eukprot:jgi/Chlat1/2453/Chrsp171S08707